jgi:FdhD protein
MRPDPEASESARPADSEEACVRRPVARFREGRIERDDDWIASEIPVALHYNGHPHVVMMATPADLEDFALGFSLSEAIIGSLAELERVDVQQCLEGYEIGLRIPASRAEAIASRQRNLSGRSSCGLCGTQQLEDVVRHPPPVAAGLCIDAAALHRALSALDGLQPLNSRTGATHAAAWAQGSGELMLVREDVGRHNALDKLVGAMAARRIDAGDGFLILTSRASYEMVQKAATMGIGLIAAISAPTALAIHLAESCGVTLIGFARSHGHVIYTHPQRMVATQA